MATEDGDPELAKETKWAKDFVAACTTLWFYAFPVALNLIVVRCRPQKQTQNKTRHFDTASCCV